MNDRTRGKIPQKALGLANPCSGHRRALHKKQSASRSSLPKRRNLLILRGSFERFCDREAGKLNNHEAASRSLSFEGNDGSCANKVLSSKMGNHGRDGIYILLIC